MRVFFIRFDATLNLAIESEFVAYVHMHHLLKHISHSTHSSPEDPGPDKVPASPRRCSTRMNPGTALLGTRLPSGLL